MEEQDSQAQETQGSTISVEDRFVVAALEGQLREERERRTLLTALVNQQAERIALQDKEMAGLRQGLDELAKIVGKRKRAKPPAVKHEGRVTKPAEPQEDPVSTNGKAS